MAETSERNDLRAASPLRGSMRRVLLGIACVGLASSALADPRDFSVDAKPVFQSSWTWVGAPISIEIENKGPDARGQILTSDGSSSTRYPIELPTGSKKRIVTYAGGSQYGSPSEYTFDSNQGRFVIPYISKSTYSYGSTAIIALISDTSGDLGFLRSAETSDQRQQNVLGDAYCTPEDAPDRPVGYQGIAAIVLGPGSERLSDASVKALQSYVLTGGTLLFIGGASAAPLSDPRWASALPATGFQTKTVTNSDFLNGIAGRRNGEAVTVASGKPIPSAVVKTSSGVAMIAERGFGIGKVMVMAFNPFEEPMVRWPGRKRLFTSNLRGVDYQRATQYLSVFEQATSSYDSGYSGYPASGYSAAPPAPTSSGYPIYQDAQDPFNIQLPAPSKVFWTLAAFFLVVVPINFGVLRAFKKGEWAWVTSPIICLAFSGIFLSQASDLYSASLSTATKGILIAQQGASEAIFVGSTKMFFPNGGSYDLKMENVDQLASGSQYPDYSMMGRQERSQVDPVDVGTIRVPDLRAANLAFEEIGFRQRFVKAPPITVSVVGAGLNQVKVTVRNNTPSPLTNSSLIFNGQRFAFPVVTPGQSHSMTLGMTTARDDRANLLEIQTIRHRMVVFETDLSDIRPGPQIGAAVSGQSSIRLLYVAPAPVGGRKL